MNLWSLQFPDKDFPLESARVAADNAQIAQALFMAAMDQEELSKYSRLKVLASFAGKTYLTSAMITSMVPRGKSRIYLHEGIEV